MAAMNPMAMLDMMKGNITFIVPNMAMMAIINQFFQGFVLVKVQGVALMSNVCLHSGPLRPLGMRMKKYSLSSNQGTEELLGLSEFTFSVSFHSRNVVES
jgi:hypothetical protein